ncbi:FHA domain-containing protein [Candidatus Woesearchaeota archaeon]|nr:FHA domain-containing protein [Candidatus Woesearchaeota archaeon]
MPRLIVQPPYERRILEVCVDKDYFLIGRAQETDLTVIDEMVSRFHATIFCHENKYYIINHSRNGTFYSGGGPACPLEQWAGFIEGRFDDFEDYQELVRLIVDPDKVAKLASEGKQLQHEDRLIIPTVQVPFEALFIHPNRI